VHRDDLRLTLACGAGAGLAGIYGVPIGGALFAIEVLLGRFSFKAALYALTSSAIAAEIAALVLGHRHQYELASFTVGASLIGWSLICGPLFGIAAYLFGRLTAASALHTPRGWKRVPWCILVFVGIGAAACLFPALPGNGRGPTQLAFDGELGLRLAAALLLLKVAAIAASLRAGTAGGLLTPGLTIGALMALPLSAVWSLFLPGLPPGACAIVGAAAFLASSMAMPLTAVALAMEFTKAEPDTLLPLALAVAGSCAARHLCGTISCCQRKRSKAR